MRSPENIRNPTSNRSARSFDTPAWSRIVGVRSSKSGDNSEVYLKTENGKIGGLAILVTEPKQLTIVSIEGTIDPDQLSELGGHFGIPKVDTRKESGHGKDE